MDELKTVVEIRMYEADDPAGTLKGLGAILGKHPPEGGSIVVLMDLFDSVLLELYGDKYRIDVTERHPS